MCIHLEFLIKSIEYEVEVQFSWQIWQKCDNIDIEHQYLHQSLENSYIFLICKAFIIFWFIHLYDKSFTHSFIVWLICSLKWMSIVKYWNFSHVSNYSFVDIWGHSFFSFVYSFVYLFIHPLNSRDKFDFPNTIKHLSILCVSIWTSAHSFIDSSKKFPILLLRNHSFTNSFMKTIPFLLIRLFIHLTFFTHLSKFRYFCDDLLNYLFNYSWKLFSPVDSFPKIFQLSKNRFFHHYNDLQFYFRKFRILWKSKAKISRNCSCPCL